jgi:hypothetical protein
MPGDKLPLLLCHGRCSAVVDGSLQDWRWHADLFDRVRRDESAGYSLAILHVTADRETVHARAAKRARATGRIVPSDVLDRAMVRVPEAVAKLAPRVDWVVEVDNTGVEPRLVGLSGGQRLGGLGQGGGSPLLKRAAAYLGARSRL